MTLRLRVVSDQRRSLGDRSSMVFTVDGGTIGRSADNDWVLPAGFSITSPTTNYLAPISAVIGTYQAQPVSTRFPDPFNQSSRAPITMFQPGFRTPYSQSFFYGLQQPLGSSWAAEAA